jgi:hypothetical protein
LGWALANLCAYSLTSKRGYFFHVYRFIGNANIDPNHKNILVDYHGEAHKKSLANASFFSFYSFILVANFLDKFLANFADFNYLQDFFGSTKTNHNHYSLHFRAISLLVAP